MEEEENWEDVLTRLQDGVERARTVAEEAWDFVQQRFGADLPVPDATQAPPSPVHASQLASFVSLRSDAMPSSVSFREDSAGSFVFVSCCEDADESTQTGSTMWMAALGPQGDVSLSERISSLSRRSEGQPAHFSKAWIDACLLWASRGREGQSETLEKHLESGEAVPYWRIFPAKGTSDSDAEGFLDEESEGVSDFGTPWHRSAPDEGTAPNEALYAEGPFGQFRQQANEWDAGQERAVLGATWAELQETEADSELYFRGTA